MPAGWGGRSDQQGRRHTGVPGCAASLGSPGHRARTAVDRPRGRRAWTCFVWGGRHWVEGHSGDAWAACGLVPPGRTASGRH